MFDYLMFSVSLLAATKQRTGKSTCRAKNGVTDAKHDRKLADHTGGGKEEGRKRGFQQPENSKKQVKVLNTLDQTFQSKYREGKIACHQD